MAKIKPNPSAQIDSELARDGIELQFPPHPDFPEFGPCSITIAYAGPQNPRWDDAMIAARKPHKFYFDGGQATEAMARAVQRAAVIAACVRSLHWPDADGNPLPCDVPTITALFDAEPLTARRVIDEAYSAVNYTTAARLAAIEAAKNV